MLLWFVIQPQARVLVLLHLGLVLNYMAVLMMENRFL